MGKILIVMSTKLGLVKSAGLPLPFLLPSRQALHFALLKNPVPCRITAGHVEEIKRTSAAKS